MRNQRWVKVKKEHGEGVRRALKAANLLNHDVKVQHDDRFVYLPLQLQLAEEEPEADEKLALEIIKNVKNAGITLNEDDVELCGTGTESGVPEIIRSRSPRIEELIGFKPSYEIIGDIAVLTGVDRADRAVADAIMKLHRNVKVVAIRCSPVEGVFRRRRIELIGGERRTETVHKENGCRYRLDLERVYFNPRLAAERDRVASLIARAAEEHGRGIAVIDMFAGVGPFSILIAKRAVNSHVIAIDINPDAVRYLRENMRLNGVSNVEPVEGDVRAVYDKFRDSADRIIMNLPKSAHLFLPEAVQMLKPEGGVIHFYGLERERAEVRGGDGDRGGDGGIRLLETMKHKFGLWMEELGTVEAHEILALRKVKAYAPHAYIIGIDARIWRGSI